MSFIKRFLSKIRKIGGGGGRVIFRVRVWVRVIFRVRVWVRVGLGLNKS